MTTGENYFLIKNYPLPVTNWVDNDIITANDLNRIEQEMEITAFPDNILYSDKDFTFNNLVTIIRSSQIPIIIIINERGNFISYIVKIWISSNSGGKKLFKTSYYAQDIYNNIYLSDSPDKIMNGSIIS